MPAIKVLPEGLKNKIRAGEVVERPASVVKELVENSLDAGAGRIEIEVKKAGRGLISVSDDGRGMDREDALLCLERHATSKLSREEDLRSIGTMGFRGEALPSIASVSRLTLATAPEGVVSGVSIEAEGGGVGTVGDTATTGTTVAVRDLFFNTPARKKFLKTDQTELMHIVEAVTSLSLSHPEVAFGLKADENPMMELPKAGDLRERLMQVYGGEFLSGLIERRAPGLHAFISKRENTRQSRSHQYIFINRRPVKERSVSHAVYASYESLPEGRHPVYFIFLDIDPKKVDVNVHPTKQEVRFEDKEGIYRFIKENLTEALKGVAVPAAEERPYIQPSAHGPSAGLDLPYQVPAPAGLYVSESLAYEIKPSVPFVYLGDTFIALTDGGGLTLIDFHAAHERVLYEKLLKGVRLEGRTLLFPLHVKLSIKEHQTILGHAGLLHELGMDVEDFGHETVLLRAFPPALRDSDMRGILGDVATEISEGEGGPIQSLKEAVAARVACHGSLRGKRRVPGPEELAALLGDLDSTERPDICPHGRPTRVRYSLDELKRVFKRR